MGRYVGMPWELQTAEMIDGLCQRYHCLPSALLAEDASLLMRLNVLSRGQHSEAAPVMGATDFEVDL